MKKYTLYSKLFGYITVQSDHLDDPDDMWLDINKYLSVNIYTNEEDGRQYANIWAMKITKAGDDGLSMFNEEIEDYEGCKIVKIEDIES